MLSYNEILPKKFIVLDGQPYEVLDAHIFRMQQRKPVNQTKLKNLITGKVTDYTFHQQDKMAEADLQKKEAKYLYNNKGEWWFCEPNKPANRFKLEIAQIGEGGRFLKTDAVVELLTFGPGSDSPAANAGAQAKIIGVRLPIKVELKVVEAPPAVKGDTSKGASKIVKLETGAEISTPLFINEGDTIRVNTETGEYVERV
ncbi:MAG: elongation factor P [Parcubacteria group bacterium Gr01-1014_73]|nr:MAG: elongation factor P [Parcubacteria group bacterium Gr01-1014_73]